MGHRPIGEMDEERNLQFKSLTPYTNIEGHEDTGLYIRNMAR
jgi:hypothetical protein